MKYIDIVAGLEVKKSKLLLMLEIKRDEAYTLNDDIENISSDIGSIDEAIDAIASLSVEIEGE